MRDPVSPAPEPFPVIAGLLCPLFSKGNVADRGIDPDIDHEIIAAGEFHAPFECPGDAPVMEFVFYPADRVILCIARAPQGVEVREQELLELRELEEVMLLVAELGFRAADLAERVLDLTRLKMLAASLVAFIPACRLAAVGQVPSTYRSGRKRLHFVQ